MACSVQHASGQLKLRSGYVYV